MIDLEKLALDPNTNTTNLHYDREKDGKNCVPTAPEAPGGLSKDLTHCQLDENNCPTVQNTDADDTSPTTADDEVSALKAELEVARRKLAEYEGSQQTNTQEPVRFRYRSAGRNLFPTADPLLPFSPDNVSVWSDTHVSHSEGSLAQIEPTNNTSPAATSPSTSPFAFKAPSLGTSVRTGLSDETKHDVGRPKNDNRGFSGPSLTPIGEPRRPMQQGSLSQDHRSPHNKQIWKAENDWNSVWPGVSSSSPPQQLTGTASLGLVYNDPLQWQNVHSPVNNLIYSRDQLRPIFLNILHMIRWIGVVYSTGQCRAVGTYLYLKFHLTYSPSSKRSSVNATNKPLSSSNKSSKLPLPLKNTKSSTLSSATVTLS